MVGDDEGGGGGDVFGDADGDVFGDGRGDVVGNCGDDVFGDVGGEVMPQVSWLVKLKRARCQVILRIHVGRAEDAPPYPYI